MLGSRTQTGDARGMRRLTRQALRFLRGLAATPRGRLWLLAGVALVVALLFGGKELERHLGSIEGALEGLGPGGATLLLLLYVVATSLLLPDTIFRVAAGALFGFGYGLLGVVAGVLLASLLQYSLARPLRPRIDGIIRRRPPLAALRRAVLHEGLRLQLLIRLTPLNHASISYVLGAAGVRLVPFTVALLAMLPAIVLEVWVGHAGRDAAGLVGPREYGPTDFVTFGGLALGVVAMVFVSRAAHAAVMRALDDEEPAAEGVGATPASARTH